MRVFVLFDHEGSHLRLGDAPQSAPAETSLERLVHEVREGQERLRSVPISDLIGACSAVASCWSDPRQPAAATITRTGMGFVPLWMRRHNLEQWCDLSLHGQRASLDRFVLLPGCGKRVFRAQPRGLVAHWVAGNVPVLGLLSLLQGALSKNANILKVSRHDSGLLPMLLESIRTLAPSFPAGERLAAEALLHSLAVIYIERSDLDAARALSSAADVRVAWGGREAVETIMNLPRRAGTEDIIHGPKVSLAIIGAEHLRDAVLARQAAAAVAQDAAAFEQRGCNCPHTVFAEHGGQVSPREFARLIADALKQIASMRPLQTWEAAETVRILNVRTEYDMRGDAYYGGTMDWTVVYSETDQGLEPPCYLRTVFVRPVSDVFSVVPHCSAQTQSAGLAVGDRHIGLAEALSRRGVERCPRAGTMALYETPWDGMFPLARLVRWVSTYA